MTDGETDEEVGDGEDTDGIDDTLGDRTGGGLSESAVVVPRLTKESGEEALLLTRRADHLPRHAGEVSFPGGSREPQDTDLEETALRELEEEVGVHPVDADVRRRLDTVLTTTGFRIQPFLADVPYPYDFELQQEEVDTVFVAGLDELVDPEIHEKREYSGAELHYFHHDEHTIWGATGEIVARLLREERGWSPD